MRRSMAVWISACGVSLAAHAAAVVALGLVAPDAPPRLALPEGHAGGMRLRLTRAEPREVEVVETLTPVEPEAVVEAPAPTPPPPPEFDARAVEQAVVRLRHAEAEALREIEELLDAARDRVGETVAAVQQLARRLATVETTAEPVEFAEHEPLERPIDAEPVETPAAPPNEPTLEEQDDEPTVDVPATGAFEVEPSPFSTNHPPEYPREALRKRQSGVATLRLVIEADGAVSDVRVLAGSGVALLDEAAVKAARSWRFEPATEGGRPVQCAIDVPVRFILR